MKAVLEYEDLEELLEAKARSSRTGVIVFFVVYALFSVVMFTLNWIFALFYLVIMALLGYFVYLGSKEKQNLLNQFRAGNFRILQEAISDKQVEKSGGMMAWFIYLDEKRRLYVSREEYAEILRGHILYTVYIAGVKLPQYYYRARRYVIGQTLQDKLEKPPVTENEEKEEP